MKRNKTRGFSEANKIPSNRGRQFEALSLLEVVISRIEFIPNKTGLENLCGRAAGLSSPVQSTGSRMEKDVHPKS